MSLAARVLLGVIVLSGCCAPDSCHVATSGFQQLDPVVAALGTFERQHGRFPEHLEELFPDGFPNGIERDGTLTGSYRFATERGGFTTFTYGPAATWLGPSVPVET